MLKSILKNVSISCLCASVPDNSSDVKENWSGNSRDIEKIIKNTGVQCRSVAGRNLCASDLCFHAAQKILQTKSIAPDEIDGLFFVSQTPDYFLPATSFFVHRRLGLTKNCAVFDVNLGCSGYVYGLWLAGSMINAGSLKKILLLSGDTVTKLCADGDRSTWPLFGDAGSATLIEFKTEAPPLYFVLGSDGGGADKLIVKNGGFRNQNRSPLLYMSGSDIFTFTIREVPPMIKDVLELAGFGKDEIDYFVFHQANMFILNHLSKKMKLDQEKVLISLDRFGNTSSATIPLTVVSNKEKFLLDKRVVFCGFGVGFSWGAVAFDTQNIEICDLFRVEEK
jgi:3-oxoacyl-[acyl-carrier-protein] synthase-3